MSEQLPLREEKVAGFMLEGLGQQMLLNTEKSAQDSKREALVAELSHARSLADRVRLIRAAVVGRIAFSTSLGLEDQAILHAIAETKAPIDVFTLDTGRHFPETLETIEASESKLGLKIRVVAPDPTDLETLVGRDGINGFRHSIAARQACCDVRKVRPLKRALAGASTWITGLRRGQSAGRQVVPFVAWDEAFGLLKLNPLADWSLDQLEAYIAANGVPVNPLHARGFPSIGCQPCTRAIAPGEDIRAGRWWWEIEEHKECGLHNRPQPKPRFAGVPA